MINQIHVALVKCIINDIDNLGKNPTSSSNATAGTPDDENTHLLSQIVNLGLNQEHLWPELIRLFVLHADERMMIDVDYLQTDAQTYNLLKKVGSLSPSQYTHEMSYSEKIDLMMFLVDTIHDLDTFRSFLNKRLDDKS